MRKRMILLSLVAASSLFASETIELKQGWNLIGVSATDTNMNVADKIAGKNISLIVTNVNGAWRKYDPNRSYLQQFRQFEPGRAYWIKSTADSNITFNGNNVETLPQLNPGWTLASFGDNFDMSYLVTQLNNSGYKLDLMVTNKNGAWRKYDPNRSYLQQFSSIDPTSGYWVKVEQLVATATTRDGYDIKLYTDKSNADVSTLVNAIPNYTISDLSNIQNLFNDVTNIVVSGTHDGQVITSSYIDPTDSSFSTALTTAKSNIDTPTQAAGGTSIYVYGLSEGGSPYIVSEAKIYKLNDDGSEGDFLGTTSQTGYLYLDNATNGEKVIVEKDGFDSTIQTINLVSGGANYIFISADDGSGTYESSAASNDTASGRLLNKTLHAWNPFVYAARGGYGAILTPADSRLRFGTGIKVKHKALADLPDYNYISENITNVAGYNTYTLSSLKVYAKRFGSFRYTTGISFSDLFDVQDGTNLNDISAVLGVKLNDDLKEKLMNNQGQIDLSKIADFKNNIKVYMYKDLQWQPIDTANIDFKVKGKSTFTDTENYFLNNHTNIDALVTINGTAYTGAYPLIAVYQEAVNITPDVTYHTYGLDVKVTEEDGSVLPNSLVKMIRGNGNNEVIGYTNNEGIAHFDVLASEGAVENISLNILEGSHYPVSRVLNISSLRRDVNNTINITMQTPPAYATVKGTITDSSDSSTIADAKVKLVYPIALADVQKDVEKIIDNRPVKGISVGAVPNAKYKWYIKAHDDTESTTNTSSRTLNRVSRQRWILVQQATSASNGNFLAYNKILAQALAMPKSDDPSDVKIIPTGQFDVAVEVEHDVDGDGNYDFVELAATPAARNNLSGEEFANANNNYGRTLGFVSTTIDVGKIMKTAGGISTNNLPTYIQNADINNGKWLNVYADEYNYTKLVNYSAAPTELNDDDSVAEHIKFVIYNNYLYLQDDTTRIGHDYNYTRWDAAISATLKGQNGHHKYVALKKYNDVYKWVELNSSSLGSINPVTDTDKFIFVQQDTFAGISYDKLGRIVAQNKILSKLAMSLSDIANEVNDNGGDINVTNLEDANKLLFQDGFDLFLIPTIVTTINSNATNGVGETLKFRKIVDVKLGGESNPLQNFIKLDQVEVDRPVLTQSSQTVHSDRVGLYQFSAVPLSYGQMNLNESLLRVESNKLGYYTSPIVNVPKFTQDNPETDAREDVQRIDLAMSEKPTYNVEVNVTDENGNALNNAVVIVDGIATSNTDLSESESVQAQEGSDITFNNVIGGRGTSRIIRVSVPNNNYIPVIKTLRNLNQDEVVNIQLQNANSVADYAPSISVIDTSINTDRGIAQIKVNITDKNDGGVTVTPANIYVRNNDDIVTPTISQDGVTFTISVPLNVGTNSFVIEAGNTVGISDSAPVRIDYNPNVGTVNGRILGIDSDANEFLVLDIYDENGLYINSAYPAEDGRYILENLRANERYKIQALAINEETVRVTKQSDLIPITIPAGSILNQDLTLHDMPSSAVSGSPVFDFIGDITQNPISSTGELNVSATLNNFDPSNGRVGIVVNDVIYPIPTDRLNEANGDYNYNIQNFTVQLRPGNNVIYGVAQNSDGSFDWTADVTVNWNTTNDQASLATLNVNITNDANLSNDGADIEIYDSNFNFVNYVQLAPETNSTSVNSLLPGIYYVNIYPNNSELEAVMDKEVNVSSGSNELNITLVKASQTIDVPDFYVSSVDINTSAVQINTNYTAIAQVSGPDVNYSVDNGYNYSWNYTYYDNNRSEDVTVPLTNCNTESCIFELNTTGWVNLNVEVSKGDRNETGTTGFTVQNVVLDTPPAVPDIEE